MRSSDFIKDVNAALVAANVNVKTHVGWQFLASEESPPRVVWVPTASGYGSPSRADASGNSGLAQRAIATRFATFNVHVWATGSDPTDETGSLDAAEDLAEQLIRAMRQVGLGNFELLDDVPIDQDVASLGLVVVVPVRISVPVTAAATATVVPDTNIGSGQADFPGSTVGPSTPPP